MERLFYYIYKITCLCGSLAGHYYFGQHRTDDLNDGYCGSGKIITGYIKKYGNKEGETYIKEILAYAKTPEELNRLEFEIIGDKFINDPLCINLHCGGYCSCGKYNTFYGKYHSEEARKKMSDARKGKTPWIKGKTFTEEQKELISQKTKEGMHKEESWNKFRDAMESRKGTHLSDEHKQKISDTFKIKGSHINGMYGKHHSEETKKRISDASKQRFPNGPFLGHHHSEETKKKMSEQRRGKNHPMYGKIGTNAGKKRVYNEDGTYKYVLI